MDNTLEMSTFRMARSMLTWSFDVPFLDGELLQAGLRRAALSVADSLGEFAKVSRITISSGSGGEHGRKLHAPGVHRATIAHALDELRDAYTIDFDLGLYLADTDSRGRRQLGALPRHEDPRGWRPGRRGPHDDDGRLRLGQR